MRTRLKPGALLKTGGSPSSSEQNDKIRLNRDKSCHRDTAHGFNDNVKYQTDTKNYEN